MTATPVSKEEVRVVVMELGYELAAQKLNIKAGTLRQWARRFNWNKTRTHAQETVTTVTKPIQVLADELAENERETRLSLARASRRMAKDCEELPVRHADKALTVAKTMAIVHKQGEHGSGNVFSLNVLNINTFDVSVEE